MDNTEKISFPNDMNVIPPMILDDPEVTSIILKFSLLSTFVPRNIHGNQLSKYLTNDMNLLKIFSNFFS